MGFISTMAIESPYRRVGSRRGAEPTPNGLEDMLATFFGWWFDFYSVQNSHKERHFIIIELQRKYLGFIYYLVVRAYYNPSNRYRGALSIVQWI